MTAELLSVEELATEWSFPLLPSTALILTACIYLRGWWKIRISRQREMPTWRALCFCGGILAIWLAIASPIDAMDDVLLLAHMTQHLILMSVGPPLLVLGAPSVPLLQGLPRFFVRNVLGFFLRQRWFQALTHVISHPLCGWLSMNVAYLGWHVPAAFELTLHSESWHNFEHLCFLMTSIGFWWAVIRPWPARSPWSRWAIVPYLVTADLVNTGLSAFLSFCGKVLYPSYAEAPRVSSLSALNDQIAAGAEMWVLGSTIFLIPLVYYLHQLLSPKATRAYEARQREREAV